ncbi:MAG: GNAT family N-acetyltransferase [Phycisphaerales bacterium]
MSRELRPLAPGQSSLCEAVLRDIPEWFGIEESLLNYVRDAERLATWIVWARGDDGGGEDAVGFMSLTHHYEHSAEIHCMAVKRAWHGRGVGRLLVRHAEAWCRGLGVEYLQVKTQGPSRPCPEYAGTTAFYERMGFRRLEEMKTLWGVVPALVLVKRV